MNKVHKIVSIDNSRSHRNGLLPFVPYNSSANTICEVNGSSAGGNYGHYVCDFVILDKNTREELHRLRYLDILNKYVFIQEKLNSAVYVQKKKTKEIQNKTTYIGGEDCQNEIKTEFISSGISITLDKNFQHTNFIKKLAADYNLEVITEIEYRRRYDYIPLDMSFFSNINDSYQLVSPIQYGDNENETLKEYNEKLEQTRLKILSGDAFVLVPNFDKVLEYSIEWENWWREKLMLNEDERWETYVFDNYDLTKRVDSFFKLPYDFDTYILGVVEVSEEYIGEKVPKYVYYTNIYDYIGWFKSNSASTMNAYNSGAEETQWRINKWESMGGEKFYNFLNTINIPWQTNHESECGDLLFTYAPPVLDFHLNINSSYECEGILVPYEYSFASGVTENITHTYEPEDYNNIQYLNTAYSEVEQRKVYVNSYYIKDTLGVKEDGEYFIKGSSVKTNGLTPFFMGDLNIECESKLSSLRHPSAIHVTDNLYGLYDLYNDNGYPQLFKCVFHSASTINAPKIDVYQCGSTISYFDEERSEINICGAKYHSKKLIETFKEGDIKTGSHNELFQVCCVKTIDTRTEISEDDIVYLKEENDNTIQETWTWSAKTINTYTWWECEAVYNLNLECRDGEEIPPNKGFYRNVTILSNIDNLVPNAEPGESYYVNARFKNGLVNSETIFSGGTIFSLKLPYKTGEHLNVSEFKDGKVAYDCVTDIVFYDDTITIQYVLGATEGEDITTSGIHYVDNIPYFKNHKETVSIDGVIFSELYYDKIDEEHLKSSVYDNVYRQSRDYCKSQIVGMEVGGVWGNGNAIETMLISKDIYDSYYNEPKLGVNLLYNRGNAAAWESHFKLSECNTLDDLEKYGNNFFNL